MTKEIRICPNCNAGIAGKPLNCPRCDFPFDYDDAEHSPKLVEIVNIADSNHTSDNLKEDSQAAAIAKITSSPEVDQPVPSELSDSISDESDSENHFENALTAPVDPQLIGSTEPSPACPSATRSPPRTIGCCSTARRRSR